MKDEALLRYSRQIMLPEMDVAGQQQLAAATVLIVGVGGLGCPAAMYLAAAGVGHLLLADDDTVELSNLQRQIAHSHADIGNPKVSSAASTLRGLNPDMQLTEINSKLAGDELDATVAKADLVLDATDNFTTRFALNRACLKHRIPMVSGAAIRLEGQVATFDPNTPASPCYECLYPAGNDADASCASNGVMAPVVGIIGAVQAMEAIKLLCGIGETLTGRLLLLDAKTMQWRELTLAKAPGCAACGERNLNDP